jgi:microcystin-dependent protein
MTAYVGEIRLFAGNFAPAGWAFCQGQLLPISENDVLFQLIGTTYGGDGQETFQLPDLSSRVPVHQGQGPGLSNNYIIGEMGGVEQVTLTTQQIPNHTHAPAATTASGDQSSPANGIFAASPLLYGTGTLNTTMHPSAMQPVGGNQPHENMAPYLGINFIISLFGVFPTQT